MLTDALGRKACGYDVAGDRKEDRFVGMFCGHGIKDLTLREVMTTHR